MDETPQTAVVVGGGVAGIAAAVALADAGVRVELIDKRPMLGGRASSYIDRETGERLDVCQHGTMRACTALAGLLERLGVHDQVRYHDTIEFLDGDGERSVIKGSFLPAPLHTAVSFARFRSLGLRDKLTIARAFLTILRTRDDAPWLDTTDMGTWVRRVGLTDLATRRFLEPVLVSACNEPLDRIACRYAFMVFRDGFLRDARAFHFGIPRVPLGTLYTEAAVAYLKARGGCVRHRTIVERIEVEGARFVGLTLQSGERVEVDACVSAVPPDLLLKLLPPEAVRGVPYFENMRRIEFSPLIGMHAWFDRPVDCPDALALLDRRTDWIFNKTRNFDRPATEPGYLSMVISADPELTAMPADQIAALVLDEVRQCLPQTRDAKVLRTRVLKEHRATFAPLPGVEALRPDQRSPVARLAVAGEWTRTGWPSTMESAARSGLAAAEALRTSCE